MNLSGKTALITGAGRGIGRAVALRFARGGANVAIAARTASELEESAAQIRAFKGTALCVPADVALETDVQRLVAQTRERFGRIDVVINNAGVAPFGPLVELSTDALDRLLAVNCRAVVLMCRAVWPIFSAGGGGTIINLSSRAATDPFPGFAAYGGSKAFVETLTRALATEGRAAVIRVFGVAPGAVRTKMLLDLFPDFPPGQMLDPDDIAGLIEWLCDERCAAASGQTLGVARDG